MNLLANALAKKKAQRAGADEALLLDDGIVREGASSSFFVVRGGRVITHPLDEHILPGVVRDRVIEPGARRTKIRVDERPLREAELFDVDEAFITSTTLGVMPVTEIDERIVGNSRVGRSRRSCSGCLTSWSGGKQIRRQKAEGRNEAAHCATSAFCPLPSAFLVVSRNESAQHPARESGQPLRLLLPPAPAAAMRLARRLKGRVCRTTWPGPVSVA